MPKALIQSWGPEENRNKTERPAQNYIKEPKQD